MKVELKGFRELERALAEELPKATAKNVLRRSAMLAMKRVELRAQTLAPRDTGGTAQGITTKNVKASRMPGGRYARATGIMVATGPVGREEGGKAAYQEFGTVNQPAQPFMRPAADTEGQAVINDVRSTLIEQIDKAKARIARKLAKG